MKILKKLYYNLCACYIYIMADRIIGPYHQVKAKKNKVNMFDYNPKLQRKGALPNNSRFNLGDYLGFVITSWMLEKKGLSLDTWIPGRRHLNTVGSTLLTMYQNSTVWGSGMLCDNFPKINYFLCRYPLTRLDIRAVRGPLTREVLLR